MTGMIARTEVYTLGKLERRSTARSSGADSARTTVTKPKEVLDFEKKTGKKKVKVQTGSTY